MGDATKRTEVIAVGNQKGGVGKTTNTVHLARALAERGKHCLIIDLDTGAHATTHLGIDPNAYMGMYEVLLGSEEPNAVLLSRDVEEGIELPERLDIIPGSRKLENIDVALREIDTMMEPHRVLTEPIAKLRGYYDYVFLDTAPNLTTPTIAAYKVADWFLLSAMPETFAIAGLDAALKDIDSARKRGNRNLKILGVVVCNTQKRTRLTRELLDYVDKAFTVQGSESKKFKTEISRSTIVSSAQKVGKTIFETEPDHQVTACYRQLAAEVEARISTHYQKLTATRSEAASNA